MQMDAMDKIVNELESLPGASVRRNVPLSTRTTYRIGGPADIVVSVADAYTLDMTVSSLENQNIPWFILGGGSKMLVSDDGYRGCVIALDGAFTRCSIDGTEMLAGGAASLAKLVKMSCDAGLSGLEQCVGIPGTLGGAIAMNAGTHLGSISKSVEAVTIQSRHDGLAECSRDEIKWGYRKGPVNRGDIVRTARLSLSPALRDEILEKMEDCRSYRSRTQPQGPSCGSVFKNPSEGSVAAMLDECGMRGRRVGAAIVSERHSNFILNAGGASARDVLSLMGDMRRAVQGRFGVDIEPETRFLGFRDEELLRLGFESGNCA